jgi:hypothetical protein
MSKVTGLIFSAVLMMAVGCQSMGAKSSGPTTMAADDRAVASVANQGTVVFLPGHGSDVKTLSASGTTVCNQCKMDAAHYFSTGMLTEKCSACGATRYALMRGK